MSQEKYPQVVRLVRETPWAILPGTLAVILDLIAFRHSGGTLTDEEIQARVGGRPARRDLQMAGSVAVIPVYGVITPRADMFTDMSGGTAVTRLQATIRDALEDDQIKSLVLDIDSPGGMTDLMPELAAEIRKARGTKPIVAVANTMAASAAYWIAAQADEIVMSPSAEVGSIGVFAAHDDISGMQEKMGVKTTLISAGKYKTEANPFEPLDDEAREEIQRKVDEFHGMFVADVAKGRRVSVATVRDDFGQGRMLTAKAALAVGMADRIESIDQTITRLTRGRQHAPPPPEPESVELEAAESGLSFAQEVAAALDAAAQAQQRGESLAERSRSLAELRQGRLSAAKRDQLSACLESLRGAETALAEVLAETDPNRKAHEETLRSIELSDIERRLALSGGNTWVLN